MILPRPHQGFGWTEEQSWPSLVCRALEPYARHAFTTRSWRLGDASRASDADAWNEVADAMAVDSSHLLRARQVHGTAVVTKRHGRHAEGPPDADIIVASDSDVALAVQVADCVPLLMADVRSGAVAAAHAGWRGLALNVPSIAVAALIDVSGGQASDLVAAIGPSIGSCCYEVGDDVRERFGAAGFRDEDLQRWFRTGPIRSTENPSILHRSTEPRQGRWFLDIWTAARDQLTAAGVQPDRILTAQLCTASHADVFCSYRRDGAAAGRLAAVIRPL